MVHEAEDDGKHDATQVTTASRDTREDAVGGWVNVRHEGKVGPVPRFHEDGSEGDEADEGAHVAAAGLGGVHLPDGDEQHAAEDSACRDPALLHPEVATESVVEHVGNDAAEGPADQVEEPENGGVAARLRLAQMREVGLVVGTEDGIDGQLAAE